MLKETRTGGGGKHSACQKRHWELGRKHSEVPKEALTDGSGRHAKVPEEALGGGGGSTRKCQKRHWQVGQEAPRVPEGDTSRWDGRHAKVLKGLVLNG